MAAGVGLLGAGGWALRTPPPQPAAATVAGPRESAPPASRTPTLPSPAAGSPPLFDVPHLHRMALTPIGDQLIRVMTPKLTFDDIDSYDAASHLVGWAAGWRLSGDPRMRTQALAMVEAVMADRHARTPADRLWTAEASALDVAKAVMGMALAYDLLAADAPPAQRRRWAAELDARARRLAAGGGPGWNPSLESNWNALARSAAGVAALVLAGEPGAAWASTATAADDCRRRVRTYLDSMGSAGWNQEGDRYLRFAALNGWMPFAIAWQRKRGEDLLAGTHARAYLDQLVLKSTWSQADLAPVMPMFGKRAGPLELQSMFNGDFTLAMACAAPAQRPWLRWTWERLLAPPRDQGQWGLRDPHQIVLALLALDQQPAQCPEGHLAKTLVDDKHGYVLGRNRWRDDDDVVACANAAASRARRCWWFQEPGSFKLNGLAARWISKEDTAAEDRVTSRWRDSLVVVPERTVLGTGRLSRVQTWPDGSFLADIDLAQVYAAPGATKGAAPAPWPMRRQVYVDHSGRHGIATWAVIVDQVAAGTQAIALWQLPGGAAPDADDRWSSRQGRGVLRAWHAGGAERIRCSATIAETVFRTRLVTLLTLGPSTAAAPAIAWRRSAPGTEEGRIGETGILLHSDRLDVRR